MQTIRRTINGAIYGNDISIQKQPTLIEHAKSQPLPTKLFKIWGLVEFSYTEKQSENILFEQNMSEDQRKTKLIF